MKEKARESRNNPEYKSLISKIQTGRIKSLEEKNKISLANRGKLISIETRLKISKNNKGVSRNKGTKISLETRINMSKAATGRKATPETLINMSKARKGVGHRKIICLNTGVEYQGIIEASIDLGIRQSSIDNILSGLAKQTKNKLIFRYL